MHRYTTGPSKTRVYPAAHIPALSKAYCDALPASIYARKVLKNLGQENGVMRRSMKGHTIQVKEMHLPRRMNRTRDGPRFDTVAAGVG